MASRPVTPPASISPEKAPHLVDGHLRGDRHRLGSGELGVKHPVEVVPRRPVHQRTESACRATSKSATTRRRNGPPPAVMCTVVADTESQPQRSSSSSSTCSSVKTRESTDHQRETDKIRHGLRSGRMLQVSRTTVPRHLTWNAHFCKCTCTRLHGWGDTNVLRHVMKGGETTYVRPLLAYTSRQLRN